MDKLKREKVIFGISFVGSIVAGMVLITLDYWLGMTIAFVGCLSAALYSRKIAVKYKMGDERSGYIDVRASALAFKISFATSCVLLAVISGIYAELEVQIPSLAVLGPIVALMGSTYGILSHYYSKKYS